MIPFFFGPTERRLFGVFQAPPGDASASTAALLCNPLGQEAVRSHRMYRVLADRLIRAGVDVLRFDYFGTGDSGGGEADGEMEGWARDVIAANTELKQRSRASRVVWIGARLGATVAVQASVLVSRTTEKLILWEPVSDGAAYLRQLSERHVLQLETAFLPWRAMVASGTMVLEREALGFDLGDALLAQLRTLSPENLTVPRALSCEVIERRKQQDVATLAARWKKAGLAVNEVVLEHEFDLMAHEAMATAIVPSEPLQLLAKLVTDPK